MRATGDTRPAVAWSQPNARRLFIGTRQRLRPRDARSGPTIRSTSVPLMYLLQSHRYQADQGTSTPLVLPLSLQTFVFCYPPCGTLRRRR